MSAIPATLTVTDLRRKSAQALSSLSEEKLFLLLQNSKPKGALVDLEYLKMLQEAYEDYLDILEFDKTVNEKTISWGQYKKESRKKR